MRDWIIRLEAAERPDGSVYVTSPTFPLFRVVAPKGVDIANYTIPLLKEYIELNAKRAFELQPADDASELFDGAEGRPTIPAYVIAQAA